MFLKVVIFGKYTGYTHYFPQPLLGKERGFVLFYIPLSLVRRRDLGRR